MRNIPVSLTFGDNRFYRKDIRRVLKTMATTNPAWLDACYVQKVLRNADQDESIEVSNVTVKAATAKGDNYASDMHRATVEFSRMQDGRKIQEKKSLIVKIAPYGDLREGLIEETGLFETELSMMSVTLPMMDEMLDKSRLNPLGARCFYTQYEKPTHLVIEDLAPEGYRMANRQAGLDLDHCLLVVRNLGRFHGSSIALKEKDPMALTKYKKGMLHKDQPPAMGQFFNLGAKTFADEAAKWPELSPRIREKLLKLTNSMYEKGCEAAHYREDDFNVLNHGDCWVNNMLFRYDDRCKPIDHIFVDFQIAHYASPAVDILYFFGTSLTDDVRLLDREILLREYHASLTSTMANLKCNTEVLSFEELKELLRRQAFCEVFASITILPVVVLEKGTEVDLNELLKPEGEYSNPGYRGKAYRKIMTRLLPWYDSMGLLDI